MDTMIKILDDCHGTINLNALIRSRNQLASLQQQKQFLSSHDIKDSFYSNNIRNEAEIELYCVLLMNSSVHRCVGSDSRIRFRIREDVIYNDILFTTSIMNAVLSCGRVESYNVTQELRKSIASFISAKASMPAANDERSYRAPVMDPSIHSYPHYGNEVEFPVPQRKNIPPYRENAGAGMLKFSTISQRKADAYFPPAHSYPPVQQYYPPRKTVESCEPIVRFLAQIRKQGMDILFPQETHDKILCAVFVAVEMKTNPAHRELIDMVMAVKENNVLSNMHIVSKTKVRGVLALLKHSDVMNTSGIEGLPVNLFLADGVKTVHHLRERHDLYLTRFIQENHIHMTRELWMEVVWRNDNDFRADRATRLAIMIRELRAFYSNFSIPRSVSSSDFLMPRADSTNFHNFERSSSYDNHTVNSAKYGQNFDYSVGDELGQAEVIYRVESDFGSKRFNQIDQVNPPQGDYVDSIERNRWRSDDDMLHERFAEMTVNGLYGQRKVQVPNRSLQNSVPVNSPYLESIPPFYPKSYGDRSHFSMNLENRQNHMWRPEMSLEGMEIHSQSRPQTVENAAFSDNFNGIKFPWFGEQGIPLSDGFQSDVDVLKSPLADLSVDNYGLGSDNESKEYFHTEGNGYSDRVFFSDPLSFMTSLQKNPNSFNELEQWKAVVPNFESVFNDSADSTACQALDSLRMEDILDSDDSRHAALSESKSNSRLVQKMVDEVLCSPNGKI